jgi:hypothetical protein
MPRTAKSGELGLENMDLGALNELAMRQHASHRIVDGPTEAAALCRHVDERNRPVFNPRVLVHVKGRV